LDDRYPSGWIYPGLSLFLPPPHFLASINCISQGSSFSSSGNYFRSFLQSRSRLRTKEGTGNNLKALTKKAKIIGFNFF